MPVAQSRQEREEFRRQTILKAARELFKRYGYKKTTVGEIALAAGITKPTIYAYFKGKRDILASLVEWEASRIFAAGMAEAGEDASAEEQLVSMFFAVDDFLSDDSFLQGIVTRDPDILTPEVIKVAFDFERNIIDAVAEILEKGMKEGSVRKGDPELMAYAVVRLHETFTFTAFFEQEGYEPEDIRNFFLEFVMAAMKP